MKLSLRLITVLCYFLPFTFFLSTCNVIVPRFAYNEKEAKANILAAEGEEELSSGSINPDARLLGFSNPPVADSSRAEITTIIPATNPRKGEKMLDRITRKVVFPGGSSLSGVGNLLLSKDLAGRIAISLSVFLAIILVLGFKAITSRKIITCILLLNILAVTAFITDSFIEEVTLKRGVWALLVLLLLQLVLEFRTSANKKVQNLSLAK